MTEKKQTLTVPHIGVDKTVAAHAFKLIIALNQQHIFLADKKAGVLLGVCLLMVSILTAEIARSGFQVSTIVPLSVALVIIILAVMVLSPKIKLTESAKENIMFFRTAASMSQEEFIEKFVKMMDTEDVLFNALIIEFHQVSLVLTRKFKFLKYCYMLCLSACLFAIVFLTSMIIWNFFLL